MRSTALLLVVLGLWVSAEAPRAQPSPTGLVTSPQTQFGFAIGDDYRLVNYTQYVEYLRRVDGESDRVAVVDIGPTAEGRREYTAIVTSRDNHRNLARYRDMNRRLALADGLSDDQARLLARDGKVVVWIDGGLHATEVLGAQQLIETLYRLASRTDPETLRILDDVIVLLTLVNPDGMELVSNWYMRQPDERQRSLAGLPRLYQKYAGHDNNRDFYMLNLPESVNASRVLFREWFPAITYNHHQTGPAGAVLFAPPFRDPFNFHYDPLIPLGIDLVGAAIHTRLAAEGKPGAVMREAAPYSTWWNGGLRTTAYFHNQIGMLTETIGSPTPLRIPFVPDLQLPRGDVPNPIPPQVWRFRQSIEYSLTANYAVLDLASKRRQDFLFNMYRMGRNSIERGSRDHWTVSPRLIDEARDALAKQGEGGSEEAGETLFREVMRRPSRRDPRGYILPADQPDFLTATRFVNALIGSGIAVDRAAAPFAVGARLYPAGSYVVKTAQAFRPHVMDMFEAQDHPHDVAYPGGPPRPPYDVAGYTLAYSMGVRFDRVLEAFDGPFERLADVVAPPSGRVTEASPGGGYLLSPETNDAFAAVNRLLGAGEDVFRTSAPFEAVGREWRAGTVFIQARPSTLRLIRTLAVEKGLSFEGIAARPSGRVVRLRAVRLGLWDQYGGSVSSGWTRWLLEQFEFPYEVVFTATLDAGDLARRFDVLLFADGAIPERAAPVAAPPDPASVPAELRDRLGAITVSRTVPSLRAFVEQGGTVLAIGSSTAIGYHLGLPIDDALVDRAGGSGARLPPERFYVPGSILEARVDTAHPLAYGLDAHVDVFFDRSPAFRLRPRAAAAGIRGVAWFETPSPLRSGWAWGQGYLEGTLQVVDAPTGRGRVVLYAPEIAWRGQTHGTFKLLFNGIVGAAR